MSTQLPPPARTAGGARLPQLYKHANQNKDDDVSTPQTNVESALSNQQRLENALLDPMVEPTDAQRDATHNPKLNASTYTHPEPKLSNHEKSRGNAHGIQNHQIQQIGGAYGSHRH